ncbi:SMP-30/gluconolactonase/LRE family protein [Streptomyces sp. ADI95-16]|uniref:SMP-30/gluconolactonase/LRE family protein n=1 Tax=Streptomyces sp. ADI95-16 TaxID=1522758 RepID=UPI00349F5CCC
MCRTAWRSTPRAGSGWRCGEPGRSGPTPTPDGALHAVVTVPASQVSSCAFAGPDLDLLMITTAADGLTPGQLAAEPHAGRIFICRPGATGLPVPPFADDPARFPGSSPLSHDSRGPA